MEDQALEETLMVGLDIAQAAGALVMQGYRTGTRARKKGRIDLVTDFDLRSEALIRARLQAAFPDHGLIAEESDGGEQRAHTWYVDPIDGTTNFAHGHPFFAISMALYAGEQPVLGIVHAPALGVTWSARQGAGTTRNGVRCGVSDTAQLEDALCATGFPYDRASSSENNFREYIAFKRVVQGVRRCGSAAIDLALVADGTYDAYWEQKLMPWDISAGAVLVIEAGGQLSDYDGKKADPRSGRLIASNGHLHAQMLSTLADARRLPPL